MAALNSSVSIDRNFWIDVKSGNQYFVAVQYPDNPGMKLEDVLNIEATGTKQSYPVKLSSLAHFRRVYGAVEVNHVSQVPVINVQLNTEGRDIASVAQDVDKAIRGIKEHLPQGMFIEFKGEFERMNESFWNLAYGMVFASVLVYLLQVALFRSWVGPFIIMFTVPLGLIGVLTMLYVTNTTLNVQSGDGGHLSGRHRRQQRRFARRVRQQAAQAGHVAAAGHHDGGRHPLSADHHDFLGHIPRPHPDGDRYRARQRSQRAFGPGGSWRPVDFDMPYALRRADHVYPFVERGKRHGRRH